MNSFGKKSITLLLGLFPFLVTAQSINLQTAIDALGDKDYQEALKYIKKAQKHEDTKNDPKTWYYTGEIHKELAKSQDTAVRNLAEDPIRRAIEAYQKCMEVGGEEQYQRKVSMARIELSSPAYIGATKAYNSQDFQKAFELFSIAAQGRGALAMQKMERARRQGKSRDEMDMDTIAFNSMFYAASAAEQIEKDSVAMQMYQQLTRTGFFKGDAYLRMAEVQDKLGDTTGMLNTIEEGLNKYPEHSNLIRKRADYYVKNGQYKKAEKSLERAAKKQPDNKAIKLILGSVYEQLHNDLIEDSAEVARTYFDKAIEKYGSVISQDSNEHNALSQLGLLYYNKGVDLNSKAGKIEDPQKRKKQQERADSYLKKAIPILNKAFEVQKADKKIPTNETVTRALMKIYAKFSMVEEYKALKKKAGYTSKSDG